jgi:hypothetical protein
MSLVIKKEYLYQGLLFLCIFIPMLNNYELTFAIWIVTSLITVQMKYSLGITKYLACFLAVFSIAFISFLFRNYQMYYVIRDITYITKPFFGFLIGYQLFKYFKSNIFDLLVKIGVVIAIIHLWFILYAVIIFRSLSMNEIRFFGGFFSDYEVYAFLMILFHNKFELSFSKKKRQLYGLIILVSIILYFARTNFIQLIILFLAFKGFYKITKKSITIFAYVIAVVIIAYASISYMNPKRNGSGIEPLLYKIQNIPNEAFKTKINRDDWKDFNDNYRSYENIRTVQQVSNDGIQAVLFGQGLGSRVDLKQKVWLGDMELRYISILHNGFMIVFLKSGVIGLLFYLTSIFMLFLYKKSTIPIVNTINLLFVGTGVFLIFSNWVFLGVFNLSDNKVIMLGLLIAFREYIIKQSIELDVVTNKKIKE